MLLLCHRFLLLFAYKCRLPHIRPKEKTRRVDRVCRSVVNKNAKLQQSYRSALYCAPSNIHLTKKGNKESKEAPLSITLTIAAINRTTALNNNFPSSNGLIKKRVVFCLFCSLHFHCVHFNFVSVRWINFIVAVHRQLRNIRTKSICAAHWLASYTPQ